MSLKRFDRNNGAPMNEINTTPFVDVMLVLLIIFIVTAPLITSTIKIDLPTTQTKETVETINVIYVSINENGETFINDKKVSQDKILNSLKELAKNDIKKAEVHLQIDRKTQYEKIAQIISEIQSSGITQLGFVNKKQ